MISNLSLYEKSLLMAEISSLAYTDNADFKPLGFDSKAICVNDTYAYLIWDDYDLIVACRGTNLSHVSDILADLQVNLVKCPDTQGRVHDGFTNKAQNIWPEIYKEINNHRNKRLWCTGHSSGAALSTIISIRCYNENLTIKPVLFTFGSPKVGDETFVNYAYSLMLIHYRWVNCTDIVAENPLLPYIHHGVELYFDAYGKLAKLSVFKGWHDKLIGYLKNINPVSYHAIEKYIENLEKLV